MSIFISYSRQDQGYVSKLEKYLKDEHSLPVWLDDHIDYGETWPRVIEEHLEQCQVFLLVMSPRSKKSEWVQRELTYAQNKKKLILPILLDGDHWFQVTELQAVNVIGSKLPPSSFVDTLRSKLDKGQAQSFTEKLGNNITLDMIAIPGGKFMMGSPEGEGRDSEKPQHEVTVQAFYMGKYPITQAQYQQVMSKNSFFFIRKNQNPSYFKGDDQRPVETVSWDEAVEFCQRLSQQTGKEYRLPTEAEWEYACRAGTKTPFHFGETITTDLANYDGNYTAPKGEYRKETSPVGSFPPNAFGLYDMHGNVWEWCQDDWHDNYKNAPTDGSAWVSDKISTKVLRGGSWFNRPEDCRSASRNDIIFRRDLRIDDVGFRVVCGFGRT